MSLWPPGQVISKLSVNPSSAYQSECQWQFTLGTIAGSCSNHAEQVPTFRSFDFNFCTDAVVVGSSADGFNAEQIVLIRVVIAQQPGRSVVCSSQEVKISVVIEIPVRSAPGPQ